MSPAEEDIAALILELTSIDPGQQVMLVNKNYLELDGHGWTVHYMSDSSSCALGEVGGRYTGSGRTLAVALRDCLANYSSRWTNEMQYEYEMSQSSGGADEPQ